MEVHLFATVDVQAVTLGLQSALAKMQSEGIHAKKGLRCSDTRQTCHFRCKASLLLMLPAPGKQPLCQLMYSGTAAFVPSCSLQRLTPAHPAAQPGSQPG